MKYAVVRTGGKQYKVSEGDVIEIEKISEEKRKTLNFPEILLVVDRKILIGQPFVEGARVEGEVLGEIKGPKIKVVRFRAKSRYRRTKGHRQIFSRIRIKKIKIED